MLETALVLVIPYYCVCDCDQNNCLKSLNDLALTLGVQGFETYCCILYQF